jgi:MFS family permease
VRLLRSRAFALLFVGSALNSIGSWAALVAMWGFASYRFHADAGAIALIGLAWAVPSALLSPFTGLPIDRLGPRRVIIAAYVLGSATSVAMALAGTLRMLILLGAVHGLSEAFARPANSALPPRLVDSEHDLLAANSLLGSASQSSIVFGPLVAAAAISAFGLRGAFIVDAATFWAAIAVMVPLRLRPVSQAVGADRDGVRLRDQIVDGVRVSASNRTLRFTMLLSVAVFLTWGTFLVIEPLYCRDVLHRSAEVFALFQMTFGVGLVGTGLLLPQLGERVVRGRAVAGAVLLSGLAAGTYIGTRSVVVAMVGVFLWGVDVAFFVAPAQTLLQRHSPEHLHGRVMALWNSVQSWANVVALPLAAALAGAWGPRATGLAMGSIAVAAGGAGWRWAPRPGARGTPVSPPADAALAGSSL